MEEIKNIPKTQKDMELILSKNSNETNTTHKKRNFEKAMQIMSEKIGDMVKEIAMKDNRVSFSADKKKRFSNKKSYRRNGENKLI